MSHHYRSRHREYHPDRRGESNRSPRSESSSSSSSSYSMSSSRIPHSRSMSGSVGFAEPKDLDSHYRRDREDTRRRHRSRSPPRQRDHKHGSGAKRDHTDPQPSSMVQSGKVLSRAKKKREKKKRRLQSKHGKLNGDRREEPAITAQPLITHDQPPHTETPMSLDEFMGRPSQRAEQSTRDSRLMEVKSRVRGKPKNHKPPSKSNAKSAPMKLNEEDTDRVNQLMSEILRAEITGDADGISDLQKQIDQVYDEAIKKRKDNHTVVDENNNSVSVITDARLVRELHGLPSKRDNTDADDNDELNLQSELSIARKLNQSSSFGDGSLNYHVSTDEQFDLIDESMLTDHTNTNRKTRVKRKLNEIKEHSFDHSDDHNTIEKNKIDDDRKRRRRIINEHTRQSRIFDECPYCIDNGNNNDNNNSYHPCVIEIGQYFYVRLTHDFHGLSQSPDSSSSISSVSSVSSFSKLAMKKIRSLRTRIFSRYECSIIPKRHTPSMSWFFKNDMFDEVNKDELMDIRNELINLQKKINCFFRFISDGQFMALFTECCSGMRKPGYRDWNHTIIECIPLPIQVSCDLRSFAIKSLSESEFDSEWSSNRNIIEIEFERDDAVMLAIDKLPSRMPYWMMQFGVDRKTKLKLESTSVKSGSGLAHIIEDEHKFANDLTRQLIANVQECMKSDDLHRAFGSISSTLSVIKDFKHMWDSMDEKRKQLKKKKTEEAKEKNNNNNNDDDQTDDQDWESRLQT